MLAPRYVVFTAVENVLLDPGAQSCALAGEALAELERRRIPLILLTCGTRAHLEPIRRRLEHGHPFITESGGALFLPDSYFSLHIPGADRVGRYFRVPFAQPYPQVTSALNEIAAEAGVSVVGYSEMSVAEIARNTGLSRKEAELDRQREFSERFFFVGDVDAAALRFAECAANRGWEAIPGDPFWEFRSADRDREGRALRFLMRLYRHTLRSRLSSVGIGSAAQDLPLLSAADRSVVLPSRGHHFDATLLSRLPHAIHATPAGPAGWNSAVLNLVGAQTPPSGV